jgi:hypothetical protein
MQDENALVHRARIAQALDAFDIIGADEVKTDAVFLLLDHFLELAAQFNFVFHRDRPRCEQILSVSKKDPRTLTVRGVGHYAGRTRKRQHFWSPIIKDLVSTDRSILRVSILLCRRKAYVHRNEEQFNGHEEAHIRPPVATGPLCRWPFEIYICCCRSPT